MATKIPPKYIRVEGKLYRRAAPIKKTAQSLTMLKTSLSGQMQEFAQAAKAGNWEEAKANLVEMIAVLTETGNEIDAGKFQP